MKSSPQQLVWRNWGAWLAGAATLSIKSLPSYFLAAILFGGLGLTIYLMGGKALYHLFNICSPFFLVIVAIAFAKDTGVSVLGSCLRQLSRASYWFKLPKLSAKPILILLVGMHCLFIAVMLYSQYFSGHHATPGQGNIVERSLFEQSALYVILFSTTIEQQMILIPPLILFGGVYHFAVNLGISLGLVAESNAARINVLLKVSGKRVLFPLLLVLPAGVAIQAAAKLAGDVHQALGAGVLLLSTFGWLFFGSLSWKIVESVMTMSCHLEQRDVLSNG